MTDLATLVPAGIAIFSSGWAGQAALAWIKGRGDAAAVRLSTETDLEKHRDGLTFQVVALARSEIALLKQEIATLRPMEAHLYHLEQALEHLDALLAATPDDRPQIERAARAFVNRMRRSADAAGTMKNEVQRVASTINVVERGATKPEPRSGT